MELEEQVRLLRQDIEYIKSCSTPMELQARVDEVIDFLQKVQDRLDAVEALVKKHDDKYFQAVTLEEAQTCYKVSGATFAELGTILNTDASNACRLLNGQNRKDDFMAYYKIKKYCLDKIAKEKKRLETQDQRKKEEEKNAAISSEVRKV